MMVNFDFLSEPIELCETKVSVLCIENIKLFRTVVGAFIDDETEANGIVFSDKLTPFKAKGNICVVEDFFRLSYSNAIMKKIYEQIEKYCNYEQQKETTQLKIHIVNFLEYIVQSFDYDFDFNYDLSVSELLKFVDFKPNKDRTEIIGVLLDYILILNKYAPPKCFVLLNLHLFFNCEELEAFYKDIVNNHIRVLVIENKKIFKTIKYENVIVFDDDFCEIIEN